MLARENLQEGAWMDGKEALGEIGKSALGLLVAALAGWLFANLHKPSREEFDGLKRDFEALKQTQGVQTSAIDGMRAEMHGLTRLFEDGLKQLRSDIRELRGERLRDTDDR